MRSQLLLVAAVALLSASLARADGDVGVLEGRIADESGAPVGGVRMSAIGTQAGQDYTTTSDARGTYRFVDMAPGLYVLSADVVGFVPEVRTGVGIHAGQTTSIDLTLRLMTIEELMRIEVTSASKLEQSAREAPSVVDVVTRDDLDRYGWISLNDVLYKQPGFGPAQDYDRRTVASRGLFEGWNNNHILHLVDGVPMNDNLYGTAYTWEITPLFMAKNVEVLRGPGSALYGSNAANGVVQVNTLSAADLDDKIEARVRIGSAGTQLYDVVGGYGAGNLVSSVFGYDGYRTDGNEYSSYDGSGRTDAAGNLAQFTTNDRRESRYFMVKLEGSKALRGFVLQYHDQYWKFQTGHGWLWWIPDFREPMEESRRIVSLLYKRPAEGQGRLSQEYLVRYQRHDIDWNTRYYPNGAFDGYYAAGMWEYLATKAEDVFARTQLTWKLPHDSTVLVGVEGDRFSYRGDTEHDSNVDVDDAAGGFPPFPDNRTTRLGPWLDWVLDQPITNFAAYGQYAARGRLGGKLDVTLGARYDRTAFDYRDITVDGRPKVAKAFSRFSPRVGLVLLPSDRLAVKLLAGRAFRAPSPTELAGAHTFSLASNIQQLRPEVITTGEAAADWKLSRYVDVRANVFWTRFENQIAYSAANLNLSTNIYTLDTAGFEAEALLSRGGLSGFVNYSYAKRLDEKIIDTTIAPSTDRLTWDPSHRVNFGVAWSRSDFTGAVSGHVQGAVERRSTDVGVQVLPLNVVSLDVDRYRPRTLGAWFTLDAKVSYKVRRNLTLGALATNLTGTSDNVLVKVLPFPFDYRQEGRRYYVSLRLSY